MFAALLATIHQGGCRPLVSLPHCGNDQPEHRFPRSEHGSVQVDLLREAGPLLTAHAASGTQARRAAHVARCHRRPPRRPGRVAADRHRAGRRTGHVRRPRRTDRAGGRRRARRDRRTPAVRGAVRAARGGGAVHPGYTVGAAARTGDRRRRGPDSGVRRGVHDRSRESWWFAVRSVRWSWCWPCSVSPTCGAGIRHSARRTTSWCTRGASSVN